MMNKKGSIQDLIYAMVIIFAFAVMILIGFTISSKLNTEFQASDDITAEGKASFNQINDLYPGVMDNSFLFLTVGLCIATLILAALVRIHPIFLVFFILAWAVLIFLSAICSNIYQTMAANPQLVAQAAQLTFVTHIMNWLPFIIGIFGGILAIVMYKLYALAQ